MPIASENVAKWTMLLLSNLIFSISGHKENPPPVANLLEFRRISSCFWIKILRFSSSDWAAIKFEIIQISLQILISNV